MSDHIFSIPGANERYQGPNPEAFLNNAANSQEVMDYIDQIYADQVTEVTRPFSDPEKPSVVTGTETYHQAAVNEALSSEQMRSLSMAEYLVSAPEEFQKERAINVTHVLKVYRDDMLRRVERGEHDIAA